MMIASSNPIIPVLFLLGKLEVLAHLTVEVSYIGASDVNPMGRWDTEDWKCPIVELTVLKK